MSNPVVSANRLFKIKFDNSMFEYMNDEDFMRFCSLNEPFDFERDKFGNIIAIAPTSSETGRHNSLLIGSLYVWNNERKLGEVFDSSTGFTLPNKAIRSPDVSFIYKERWKRIDKIEKEKFASICPDFVIELKSPSNSMEELHEKMIEYIDSGVLLGWLINVNNEEVFIYKPGVEVQLIKGFSNKLSGENILPGFELDLTIFKS